MKPGVWPCSPPARADWKRASVPCGNTGSATVPGWRRLKNAQGWPTGGRAGAGRRAPVTALRVEARLTRRDVPAHAPPLRLEQFEQALAFDPAIWGRPQTGRLPATPETAGRRPRRLRGHPWPSTNDVKPSRSLPASARTRGWTPGMTRRGPPDAEDAAYEERSQGGHQRLCTGLPRGARPLTRASTRSDVDAPPNTSPSRTTSMPGARHGQRRGLGATCRQGGPGLLLGRPPWAIWRCSSATPRR